jgi:hypothetical protein
LARAKSLIEPLVFGKWPNNRFLGSLTLPENESETSVRWSTSEKLAVQTRRDVKQTSALCHESVRVIVQPTRRRWGSRDAWVRAQDSWLARANDSYITACSALPEKIVHSPLRKRTALADRSQCSEGLEGLHCCERTVHGSRQLNCRLQKRTCWLLTLWIDGRISKRAFPQKSASTPYRSFELFGRQQHATPN